MTDRPAELRIHTAHGTVPLSERNADMPLPRGPEGDGPLLHYGPYLRALSGFFEDNGGARLLEALEQLSGKTFPARDIRRVVLTSEKHGALYQVARLDVVCADGTFPFAINTAVTEHQKAFLETEGALLAELHSRFRLPHLPRPILTGRVCTRSSASGEPLELGLLVTEWFEGFCEFHLSLPSDLPAEPHISIWENDGTPSFLSVEEEAALYREASAILTAYFDTRSFNQIHPWHHAAGDFVANRRKQPLSVRLITARGFRPLGDFPAGDDGLVIAALHFFVNLSLRMRLDRLDGTGELTWASPQCLKPIIEGFTNSWTTKRRVDPTLPSADHLLSLLGQFSRDDWISFGGLVLHDGRVEKDEVAFMARRLSRHVEELSQAVAAWLV